MAQRGNRAKHVAGVRPSEDAPTAADEVTPTDDAQLQRTAGGGGMAKTSPKLRKAEARSVREEEREASTGGPGSEASEDDFRTETVPGPGPRDAGAGRATTKQLETHDLKPRH